MAFIMPEEVNEHLECKRWLKKLKDETPIKDLRYIDIKQSMMNGGGPACLRFKIVVTEDEFNNINSDFILNDNLILKLEDLIQTSHQVSGLLRQWVGQTILMIMINIFQHLFL